MCERALLPLPQLHIPNNLSAGQRAHGAGQETLQISISAMFDPSEMTAAPHPGSLPAFGLAGEGGGGLRERPGWPI